MTTDPVFGKRTIYDISVSLSSKTPIVPGQPPFQKEPLSEIARGGRANVSKISMTTHTGTHVDSPFHFVEDGITIDKIDLKAINGVAKVFDLKVPEQIDKGDLEDLQIAKDDIVLFKTRNSALWKHDHFTRDYVCITPEAAKYLASKQVRAVGVDYAIPEAFDDIARPVHHTLLGKGVILIEGLDLSDVPAGEYVLVCLPLKITEGDGAPARAMLVTL